MNLKDDEEGLTFTRMMQFVVVTVDLLCLVLMEVNVKNPFVD
jgi:hypothetical protein